ncbi:MAG: hypothetical protein ACFFBD_07415 [Candidatus Hodarchaeota archaeon]
MKSIKNLPEKISRCQHNILCLLSDQKWVYISKFPKKERAALLEMEDYGLIQVKGRERYDFALWGQVRCTKKGKEFISDIGIENIIEEEKKIKSKKPRAQNPRAKPSKPTKRRSQMYEEDSECYELTLDEINRIRDPNIRTKLLLLEARRLLGIDAKNLRSKRSRRSDMEREEEFEELEEDPEEQDAYEVEIIGEYDGSHSYH